MHRGIFPNTLLVSYVFLHRLFLRPCFAFVLVLVSMAMGHVANKMVCQNRYSTSQCTSFSEIILVLDQSNSQR